MTHVSKHKLSPVHQRQLFAQLTMVLERLDKNTAHQFLNELLGPEEKIMLAKRLAAIAMCIENNSSYRISQLLLMSPSTTERIKLNYESGRYTHIEHILTKKRKEYEEFWEMLEIVLRAGMPPMGRGRWKSVLKRL